MPQIECKNLILGYEGVAIATDLNFRVDKGEYLCIVGENGSGKSTLMKTLLGLTPAMGGEILYGEELDHKMIGYLPQQTPVQKDFPASVKEVVLSGCQPSMGWRPFYSHKEKKTAKKNMERMGIEALQEHCYRDLSGGQQQRVLLARALCATQKILLLDEPVSGLDPKVTLEMYQLITKLNKEDHITIMMISHDVEAAVRYATHILHIDAAVGEGQAFFGTVEEYKKSEIGKRYLKDTGKGTEDGMD